ncbi:MAG: hydroxypyruvate reductase [Rhodocyclaceae bacterium]|nr:MAG: hydroxypyruvate reductase [Rhodocyclaceae bacterium]TND00175.1 MAG: hydroxypyruvate reductase [Rhodocyclaceae bacterium]
MLRGLFDAAVAAADPARCLPAHLPEPPDSPEGRTVIVGAGKAAAAMARAVEDHWRGDPERLSGLVVTRYGHGAPTRRIEVVEAAHPTPDVAGQLAAARILELVSGLTANDLVLVLLSGGGSALLAAPMAGITLEQKRAVTKALLASGASIGEINCVRKHLSAIKGGRLALAAAPARVVTLAISDVPGDDLSTIASGPTVPDPTRCVDALEIVERYGIELPAVAREALLSGVAETPKVADPGFSHCESHVIATAQSSLAAAAAAARALGIAPLVLGDAIEGEAREAARVLGGIALSCAAHGVPLAGPCVLLSGGETTVTVRGSGRGGRNAEFLLGLALTLGGHPRIHAIACDTDGIDGSEDNAGALLLPDTPLRAMQAGIDLRRRLAENDAYSVFAALGDLVVTGPTRTNVNDFRAILIEAAGSSAAVEK